MAFSVNIDDYTNNGGNPQPPDSLSVTGAYIDPDTVGKNAFPYLQDGSRLGSGTVFKGPGAQGFNLGGLKYLNPLWSREHQGQYAFNESIPFFQSPTEVASAWNTGAKDYLQTPFYTDKQRQDTLQDIEAQGPLQQAYPQFQEAWQRGMSPENYATQALFGFDAAKANLPLSANLNPYYDYATNRAIEDIDAMAASRGAYGTSAALDVGKDATAQLRAEQANREAQYALDRAAEQRRWEQTGISAADMAQRAERDWMTAGAGIAGGVEDIEFKKDMAALSADMGMNDQEMTRTMNMLSAATGVDAAELSKTMNYLSAAMKAEGLTQTEMQQQLDNVFREIAMLFGGMGGMYGSMFNEGTSMMDAALMMELGIPSETLRYNQAQKDQRWADAGNLMSLWESWQNSTNPMGGGGGGEGGGGAMAAMAFI